MKRERLLYLDFLRSLAIILVVFCHAIELFYPSSYNHTLSVSQMSFYIQTLFYLLSRLGVPIFLMITGVLMINSKEININLFYKKYLLPLLLITELWIILNNLFYSFIFKIDLDVTSIINQMLFLEPLMMKQMWYMPLILGIYLFIPFIKLGIEKYTNDKIIFIPLCLGIITYFLIPTINILINAYSPESITRSMNLDLSFIGGIGGIYIFTGYFLNKFKIHFNTIILFLLFTITLLINVYCLLYLRSSSYEYSNYIWYSNFFTYLSSMSLFLIIKNIIGYSFCIKIIFYISKISFAIFLIHMIILTFLFQNFGVLRLPIPIQIVFYSVLTLVISIFIIYTFDKLLPYKYKKAIFYIR